MYDIVNYWFSNENNWFSDKNDKEIYDLFKHYLNEKFIFNKHDTRYILGQILFHDQIVRHINRIEKINLEEHLNIAIKLVNYIFNNNLDKEYKLKEKIFILLPYRHSNKLNLIEFSINYILQYPINSLSKRFLKASYLKYGILKNNECDFFLKNLLPNIYNFNEVLEFNPSTYDIEIERIKKSELYKIFYEQIKIKNICVSLSGGVDSMVCVTLLKALYPNNVSAIHINYCNRDVSDLEQEFVVQWCIYQNIPIAVRKINEIRRSSELRDIYEDITQKIRFDFYRKLKKNVILGHNKDDCFENIMSNIQNGKNYGNLLGMIEYMNYDDINIYRPLLTILKKDIFKFAHEYNIPYLKDTTPKWSQRAKIRGMDYKKEFKEKFFELSENIKDDEEIIKYFCENGCEYLDGKIKIEFRRFSCNTWKKIIKTLLPKINISNKSYKQFYEKLYKISYYPQKIVLNKDIICEIKNRENIFINVK